MHQKLNAKTYAIMVKKDKVLNQWLEEQLKIELIVESSSIYTALYFYIPMLWNEEVWEKISLYISRRILFY